MLIGLGIPALLHETPCFIRYFGGAIFARWTIRVPPSQYFGNNGCFVADIVKGHLECVKLDDSQNWSSQDK